MPSPRPNDLALLRLAALPVLLTLACASPSGIQPRGFPEASLPIALERFMGDWYVIAHLPTSVEANAYDAIERYALRPDGTIDVEFRFCEGASDGPLEQVTMTGWVHDPATGAEWRVRPIWPLRLAYQILELDDAYRTTVVGHPSGSYAWVMAREPSLPADELAAIQERLAAQGYDMARWREVPHGEGCPSAGAEAGA